MYPLCAHSFAQGSHRRQRKVDMAQKQPFFVDIFKRWSKNDQRGLALTLIVSNQTLSIQTSETQKILSVLLCHSNLQVAAEAGQHHGNGLMSRDAAELTCISKHGGDIWVHLYVQVQFPEVRSLKKWASKSNNMLLCSLSDLWITWHCGKHHRNQRSICLIIFLNTGSCMWGGLKDISAHVMTQQCGDWCVYNKKRIEYH